MYTNAATRPPTVRTFRQFVYTLQVARAGKVYTPKSAAAEVYTLQVARAPKVYTPNAAGSP